MKKLVLTLTLAIAALLSFAQIPQTFSYQGVVRDAESKIVAEKPITVSVQILQGTDEGTEVYAETHEVTTNANGLMTFELGSKDAEKFAKIDWSNAPYFVKTVASFDGKQISGVTPLLAVPYALYAAKTDLSGYYSKEEVDALLAALESKIENGNENSNDNGAIKAAFSVSADKKVYFSQGNLQYQASTGTWRFAEHQWDFVGTQNPDDEGNLGGTVNGSDNANISENYDGWIDLFGWGTSGYNDKFPYMTSTTNNDYGDGANDIAGTNYDWGVNNAISNGGNQAGMWRTLTKEEWIYLIKTRADASSKRGVATVNSVTGLVLLPDDWALPAGVTFASGGSNFSQNTYFAEDWAKMEANGAVFLPAAGRRGGTGVSLVGSYGYYRSSSASSSSGAHFLMFRSYDINTIYGDSRSSGQSVRLVQDAE